MEVSGTAFVPPTSLGRQDGERESSGVSHSHMEYYHPDYPSVKEFKTLRFSTVLLLVVPKIEEDVERSTFFNGFRSLGSRAQMDT
ncbi:hypothetical protein TNCV_1718861 [Trichonephila clavipes]|nr:hypothetical protein TNCV_1718861 [Trichonephila clavipes]